MQNQDGSHSENTKSRILESAYRVFLQKGVDGAGIKEIADRADVNKAMLYYYYDSKQHLFQEVFRLAVEQSGLTALEELENPHTGLLEKIREYIDDLVEGLSVNPDVASFIMNEINRHPDLVRDILGEVMDFDRTVLERQVNEAADRYEIARVDPRHLMINITALCLGPIAHSRFYGALAGADTAGELEGMGRERAGIIYDMVVSWLTG